MLESLLLLFVWLLSIAGFSFSFRRVNLYITKYRLPETEYTLLWKRIHLRHIKKIYLICIVLMGIFIALYTVLPFIPFA